VESCSLPLQKICYYGPTCIEVQCLALQREEAEEADFREVQKIQIFRTMLVNWLKQPFFERTLPGTVVRLSVKGFYMVAEVEAVVEQEPGSYR
jgi:Plus-3 domain